MSQDPFQALYSGIGGALHLTTIESIYPTVCVCVVVCVYTVITNGFSSVYCACTILKKQGAEVPMSLPLPTKLGDMW